MRRCNVCQQDKPDEELVSGPRYKGGRRPLCLTCQREQKHDPAVVSRWKRKVKPVYKIFEPGVWVWYCELIRARDGIRRPHPAGRQPE
jgi:hypothetical protein